MHKGSCMCGAVTFVVEGKLPGPDACHCRQCRKHSGHYFASSDVPRSRVRIHGEGNVGWYQSSEKARRGFCSTCGSTLFWDPLSRDWIGIAMGAFDTPTATSLSVHIFTAEKGDYYRIADSVPQFEQVPTAPH
ncbi:MAG TPA: GFA family protein [Allosphingosinicella sp.]|uniref:GFA family protein n=1 Tax=Allosphingosinicella sp. TaxID=2823234 RepID=UPI002ED8F9E3